MPVGPSRHPGLVVTRSVLACALVVLIHGAAAGERRWVRDLSFQGVDAVEAGPLREGLALQDTSWWHWLPFVIDKHWYDASDLQKDVERIEVYYKKHGFFEVRVDPEVDSVEGQDAVDVLFRVQEGEPTTIDTVRIAGLDELAKKARREAQEAIHVAEGQRFSYARFAATKTNLERALKANGHAYASVDGAARVDPDLRKAAIQIQADSGPLVRFGAAKFENYGPIPLSKLRRLVAWEEGEVFEQEKLDDTRRRLIGLRVFSRVRLSLPEAPTERAPVDVDLALAPLRELRLGGGVGFENRLQEVRLKARWIARNFLGGLRTLTLRVEPAYVFVPNLWNAQEQGPGVESDVELVQPDFFGTSITLFGLLGYDVVVRQGFRYHGPRVQLGGERYFLDDVIRIGASWNLQYLDFFEQDRDVFDVAAAELGFVFQDPYRLAYFEEFIQLDLRDRPLDPRAGFWASLRLEQGRPEIAGEFAYLKFSPELRGYIPLGTRRVTLALRAMLGYLRPQSLEDSPVTRRLYYGGPINHRGFSFGRLSPQRRPTDGGAAVPLGGNAGVLFSAGVRIRIVRLGGAWLSFDPFVDAGDVRRSFGDLELDNLHIALGGAFLYQTPIGAIRAGIGVRLNRLSERLAADGVTLVNPDPGEPLAFHLTIGQPF